MVSFLSGTIIGWATFPAIGGTLALAAFCSWSNYTCPDTQPTNPASQFADHTREEFCPKLKIFSILKLFVGIKHLS